MKAAAHSTKATAHSTLNPTQVGKSLEAATAEYLLGKMCGGDARYLSIPAEAVEALTLDDVKKAITSRLTTDNIELSISGDITPVEVPPNVHHRACRPPPSF